jgi:hypothetical protein
MTAILILAANPKGTSSLELNREIRDVSEGLKRSKNRDRFPLEQRVAVRPKDLQAALLETKPRIVHFCGHGAGSQGLVLENDVGLEHLVSTEALANLFGLVANWVECVLLNACYSEVQAQAIVEQVNYVIGMHTEIRDEAAIAFTMGFYEALGAGESIESAYKFGCNRIQLEISRVTAVRKGTVVGATESVEVPEHQIPVLLKKGNPNPIYSSEEIETMPSQNPSQASENQSPSVTITIGSGNKIRDVTGLNKHEYVNADVIGGNKYIGTIDAAEDKLSKEELLQLLNELKNCLKQARFDEDDKDVAVGQVATAIQEAKKTDEDNQEEQTNKIGHYLKETKTILDKVKDIGEIGEKAFPILARLAKFLSLSLL